MNTAFKSSIKSKTLVFLQFTIIFVLLGGTVFSKMNLFASSLLIVSVLLIGWAAFAMRKSKLRIMPEPAANATLITNGPYQYIRHPMYTAVLLFCVGLLLCNFSLLRTVLVIALIIVLIIKLTLEEKLLLQKFEAYQDYHKQTYRLIPLVF